MADFEEWASRCCREGVRWPSARQRSLVASIDKPSTAQLLFGLQVVFTFYFAIYCSCPTVLQSVLQSAFLPADVLECFLMPHVSHFRLYRGIKTVLLCYLFDCWGGGGGYVCCCCCCCCGGVLLFFVGFFWGGWGGVGGSLSVFVFMHFVSTFSSNLFDLSLCFCWVHG